MAMTVAFLGDAHVAQATALDEIMASQGALVVVDIAVPDDALVARLALRRVCGQCGNATGVAAGASLFGEIRRLPFAGLSYLPGRRLTVIIEAVGDLGSAPLHWARPCGCMNQIMCCSVAHDGIIF